MNLQSLNVQELSLKEQRETDGGWVPLAIRIASLALAVLEVDWDEAIADFKRGYNEVRN